MRTLLNDYLRYVIGWTLKFLGLVGSGAQLLRIISFRANQKRLKRKYGIYPNTPLRSYGLEVERSITNVKHGSNARFATRPWYSDCSVGPTRQIAASFASQPSFPTASNWMI